MACSRSTTRARACAHQRCVAATATRRRRRLGCQLPGKINRRPLSQSITSKSWLQQITAQSVFSAAATAAAPQQEWDAFIATLKRPLPITFRINGQGQFADRLLERLERNFMAQFAGKEGKELEVRRGGGTCRHLWLGGSKPVRAHEAPSPPRRRPHAHSSPIPLTRCCCCRCRRLMASRWSRHTRCPGPRASWPGR